MTIKTNTTPTSLTKNELTATVIEEIKRFQQNLLSQLKHSIKGCDAGDYGCCQCEAPLEGYREIDEIIQNRPEVLLEFIESNKEPLREFFQKKGIKLTR